VVADDHGMRGMAALRAESFEPEAVTHEYFLARSRFLRELVSGVLRDAQELGEVAPRGGGS
jgi:hypothetical protein